MTRSRPVPEMGPAADTVPPPPEPEKRMVNFWLLLRASAGVAQTVDTAAIPAINAIARFTMTRLLGCPEGGNLATERPPVKHLRARASVDQRGGVVGDVEVALARGTLVVARRRPALGQVELGRLAVLVGHHRQEVGDAVDARPLLVVGLDLVPGRV